MSSSARSSPPLLVRAFWFVFVGWWLTGLLLGLAWLLSLTIIGIPFAIVLINRIPKALTLKERHVTEFEVSEDGTVVESEAEQYGLLVRAAYFLLIGWWASGIWMSVAYTFALTVIGLPVAIWMFNQLPFVVSLYRY